MSCDAVVSAPWLLLVWVLLLNRMHFWSRGALFSCPPFFPPVDTSAGVCTRLPYDQVLRYTSCSAGFRCRCRCLCRCMCRFRIRCRCYPCGYFRGGRVEESDGECCSQGGAWARPGPGAGPPAPVRPAGAGPAHQAHQARRRRSGPPGPPGPPAQVRPTGQVPRPLFFIS